MCDFNLPLIWTRWPATRSSSVFIWILCRELKRWIIYKHASGAYLWRIKECQETHKYFDEFVSCVLTVSSFVPDGRVYESYFKVPTKVTSLTSVNEFLFESKLMYYLVLFHNKRSVSLNLPRKCRYPSWDKGCVVYCDFSTWNPNDFCILWLMIERNIFLLYV